MYAYLLFSVSDIFPQVSLNFAGGASMILRPQDYLIQQGSIVSFLFSYFQFLSTCLDIFFSPKMLLSWGEMHLLLLKRPYD